MSIFRDDGARDLIAQHMRECEESRREDRHDREVAAKEVARKLESQNELTKTLHEQNLGRFATLEKDANARFVKLMWAIVMTLLTIFGAFVMDIVRLHSGAS